MAPLTDGVISVESTRNESTLAYAAYKLVAHKKAIGPEFESLWQRPEEDGTSIFLLTDTTELTTLKADLDRYGITYDTETNVELTVQQKGWLDISGIKSRAQVETILARAQRISDAPADGWKDEALRAAINTR